MQIHYIGLLCITILLTLSTSSNAKQKFDSKPTDPYLSSRVTSIYTEMGADEYLPGTVVALVKDGRLVHVQALGKKSLQDNAPLRADAVFPLASVTKTVVALFAASAHLEGNLALDNELMPLLPGLHPSVADIGISMRQLLTHRAGLPRDIANRTNLDLDAKLGFDPTIPAPGTATRQRQMAGMASTPIAKSIGSARAYSNYGFDLAAFLIERNARQTMTALIRERIAAPLGLLDFTAEPSSSQLARIPTGYLPDPATGSLIAVPTWQPQEVVGGTGLYATAADLARYLAALIRAGDRNTVVSAAAVELLVNPGDLFYHSNGGIYRQGLAWWIDDIGTGGPIYRHNGDADGHSTYTAWSRATGIAVVALSTGSYEHNYRLGNELLVMMLTSGKVASDAKNPSP